MGVCCGRSSRQRRDQREKTPVGKAWRLFTQGQNRIGDVECHVSYLFVDGDTSYVLRFASTNSPEAILNIEAQVAPSFRVRKK